MRRRISEKWKEIEWWFGVWMVLVLVGSSARLIQEYKLPKVSESYAIESVAYIPTRVMIPKMQLVSDLVPQPIVDRDWLISEMAVNYLIGSGNLDEGNMVLYAHRKPNLFGRLPELKSGDFITVTGNGDRIGYYKVTDSYSTSASDLEILNQTKENRLTLFTCDGWNDNKRWVVKAVKFGEKEV